MKFQTVGCTVVLSIITSLSFPARSAAGALDASHSGASVTGFTNLNFELGTPGETPLGWFVPRGLADQGFSAILTTNPPSEGRQCVEIRWPTNGTPTRGAFANLMQSIDATALRGRQIKVTAAIRIASEKTMARAQMWLRVDRPGGRGAFDNMRDRPVISAEWADYSITADVAEDARTVNLGLLTLGGATAWWDNVRCEVLGEFNTVTEPPRHLTDAGLSNLVAFTRLLGFVRHFHPSDQAASNDWLAFIATALPQIETATDPTTLAARLNDAFRPVAPTVRVFPDGREPSLPSELTRNSDDDKRRNVRVWEHIGYAQSSTATARLVYSSERLSLNADDLATLPAYARPTNVFRSSLGAGVACFVPTAVFANERGTLPTVEQPPAHLEHDLRFSVGHRGARLGTVMWAWNVLQHFYPYFDVIHADWSKELEGALRKAAVDTDEDSFFQTLNRLIAALDDGHGSLAGPGAPAGAPLPVLLELMEDQIVVSAVADGTTQVRPGDVVERIDGIEARTAFDQIAAQVSSAKSRRKKRMTLAFGWQPKNREVTLDVRGEDGVTRTVTLPRGRGKADFNRPPKLHEIRPGVFYVDITRLTDADFNEALPRLAKATGLIFDMRGYPTGSPTWLRHLSDKPMQSARWNIPRQHRPDRTDVEWVTSRWDLPPAEPQLTTNRVFLTDGDAISYAESVMGIVEAYRLGPIVGEPTAGTNGNVNQTELPLGYRMAWTGMQVLKHDGTQHHGIGIIPTISVSRSLQGLRAGRDEQLERALEVLK